MGSFWFYDVCETGCAFLPGNSKKRFFCNETFIILNIYIEETMTTTSSKGQAAVEYLISTSFLLMVTTIIFVYAIFVYGDSAAASSASTSATTIVSTVNQVNVLGPETVLYNEVAIPANVQDVRIEDRNGKSQLVIELKTSAGITQISKTANGFFAWGSALTPTLLKSEGRYPIRVYALPYPNEVYPRVCVSNSSGGCQ